MREAQHGGKYWLEGIRTGLTRRQAQAIEQLIIEANLHFDNKIAGLSRRHAWFDPAMDWARKAMRGRKIRF